MFRLWLINVIVCLHIYDLVLVLFYIAFWPLERNCPLSLNFSDSLCLGRQVKGYSIAFPSTVSLGHYIIKQMSLVKVQTCADKRSISVK